MYLTGGTDLSDPPVPIFLRNGDLLVMSGEQRWVYHAVPKVLANTVQLDLPENIDEFHKSYLKNNRVNITIRQVNPNEKS